MIPIDEMRKKRFQFLHEVFKHTGGNKLTYIKNRYE